MPAWGRLGGRLPSGAPVHAEVEVGICASPGVLRSGRFRLSEPEEAASEQFLAAWSELPSVSAGTTADGRDFGCPHQRHTDGSRNSL